jgi:hypothetical protein
MSSRTAMEAALTALDQATRYGAGGFEDAKQALRDALEQRPMEPRREFLALAEQCGAKLTGKPDGSESVTVVFTVEAWRAFDAAVQHPVTGQQPLSDNALANATGIDYGNPNWHEQYEKYRAVELAHGIGKL